MKAIVEQDIIRHVSPEGDTEIGQLPKGIGLERLRWTGKEIVDLATLSQIWVEEKAGAFILHAIKVPGSQLVTMTYRDRKRLTKDPDGTIRLKTSTEIQEEQHEAALKARLAKLDMHELRALVVKLAQDSATLQTRVSIPSKMIQRIVSKLGG